MRDCGQKRLVVEAAGGLRALMLRHPRTLGWRLLFARVASVAGCGYISKVVHVGKVLCCLPHSPTPLPNLTAA